MMTRLEKLEVRTLLGSGFVDEGEYQEDHTSASSGFISSDSVVSISFVHKIIAGVNSFFIARIPSDVFLLNTIIAAMDASLVGLYLAHVSEGFENCIDHNMKEVAQIIVAGEAVRFTMNFAFSMFQDFFHSNLNDHLDKFHQNVSTEVVAAFWKTYGSASTYVGVSAGMALGCMCRIGMVMLAQMEDSEKNDRYTV